MLHGYTSWGYKTVVSLHRHFWDSVLNNVRRCFSCITFFTFTHLLKMSQPTVPFISKFVCDVYQSWFILVLHMPLFCTGQYLSLRTFLSHASIKCVYQDKTTDISKWIFCILFGIPLREMCIRLFWGRAPFNPVGKKILRRCTSMQTKQRLGG